MERRRPMTFLLDWRLRQRLAKYDLPDLPEVRRLMRLSYWNGFTFGALKPRVAAAGEEALRAVAADRNSRICGHSPTPPPGIGH
jgi:hypothetical protein